jgi:hypothetical protein
VKSKAPKNANPLDAASAAAALRLLRCPRCEYSLEGLPGTGACPECGGTYSEDEIILFGWSVSHRKQGSIFDVVVWLCAAISIAATMSTLARSRAFAVVLVFFLLIFVASWFHMRKLKSGNAGVLQLRLTRDGYGVRLGNGEVLLNPWRAGIRVIATRWGANRFLIAIEKPDEKFWEFKMSGFSFSPVNVVFDGDLAIGAQMLLKLGKWWGLAVQSYVETPYYKRCLSVGPLTDDAIVRAKM